MKWQAVIGLEVHVQLLTQSKLFSSAAARFCEQPNHQANFIDAGLPGVLPVLNEEAVKLAIQFGLAVDAEINPSSTFERKNYFYPDLPKGYQISQYEKPIVSNGHLMINIDGQEKKITIERAHLEEDAGKSVHELIPGFSGIDLNRAGTALLEIVTTPCMFSSSEAVSYLKKLHQLVRFLKISDGNMQEGSFRCDVNISLKAAGSDKLGTRCEIKNLNSFRFIEKAIEYEISRQSDVLNKGQAVIQETRLFCPDSGKTRSMRLKEEENDYRYFPDPDLLPVVFSNDDIENIKTLMPERPDIIEKELVETYQLSEEDSAFILASLSCYQYFQALLHETKASAKTAVNWLKGPYAALLNESGNDFDNPPVKASTLGVMLDALESRQISHHQAKGIFQQLASGETAVKTLIQQQSEEQHQGNSELLELIQKVIDENQVQVEQYRSGKDKLLGFFVGQVMKMSKGKADPATVNSMVKQALNK